MGEQLAESVYLRSASSCICNDDLEILSAEFTHKLAAYSAGVEQISLYAQSGILSANGNSGKSALALVYCADKSNTQTMFSLDRNRYKNLTSASMLLDLELIDAVIERNKLSLALSPDIISGYFDKGASSLFNLIQLSERNVRKAVSKNA